MEEVTTCLRCTRRVRRMRRGALNGWQDDNGDLCCPGGATPHEGKVKEDA